MSCSQAARARYFHNQALLVRLELEDFENEQARACSSSIYGARYTSLELIISTLFESILPSFMLTKLILFSQKSLIELKSLRNLR